MAHYALLNEDNIVTQVIVLCDEDIADEKNPECDCPNKVCQKCVELFGCEKKLVKTSFNNKLNGSFASIGSMYDETLDMFIKPKPENELFDDFIFDTEEGEWVPPLPKPELTEQQKNDGIVFSWDAINKKWFMHLSQNSPGPAEPLTDEQREQGLIYVFDEEQYLITGELYKLHNPAD